MSRIGFPGHIALQNKGPKKSSGTHQLLGALFSRVSSGTLAGLLFRFDTLNPKP